MRHVDKAVRTGALLILVCLAQPLHAAQDKTATSPAITATESAGTSAIDNSTENPPQKIQPDKPQEKKSTHKKGMAKRKSSAFLRWKMHLSFWPRKLVIFAELLTYILAGVFLGQALEVMGVVRWLAVLTYPFLWLGRLPAASGPAFIFSLQSGAVANSMLVSEHDQGKLSRGQLYASVLVVSCLSLFAHLPTFIMPLGMALGWSAAIAFFLVRFGAIAAEISCILLASRVLIPKQGATIKPENLAQTDNSDTTAQSKKADGKWYHNFFGKVWKRSRRTALRLLIFVVPSFFIMTLLEYADFFKWLEKVFPGLFDLGFLPSEAAAIIPAQAASLYNGAAIAGNFVESGSITGLQAAAILLTGSLITAPIRTMKHALPTYLSILGPRTGTLLAVTAQILRILFTGAATALLFLYIHLNG